MWIATGTAAVGGLVFGALTNLAQGWLPGAWNQLANSGAVRSTVAFADTGPGSLRLAARTLTLADQPGIPTVLTNAIRYADRDQHRLADVLDAARFLRPIDSRRLDSGECWLKDPAAMHEIAHRIAAAAGHGDDRAARLMADTAATADACTVDPEGVGSRSRQLPGFPLRVDPVGEPWWMGDGAT